MSADAKVRCDEHENGWHAWKGTHDGPCATHPLVVPHDCGDTLTNTLTNIELCLGRQLRWELREYGNGFGLAGYEA